MPAGWLWFVAALAAVAALWLAFVVVLAAPAGARTPVPSPGSFRTASS